MAVPVTLTDGKTIIQFVNGKLPIDSAGGGSVDIDTVNAAVTMNVSVTNPAVTVDGSVNVANDVTVNGSVNVANAVTINGAVTVTGQIESVPTLDSGIVDAFGRQRVSELETIFSSISLMKCVFINFHPAL